MNLSSGECHLEPCLICSSYHGPDHYSNLLVLLSGLYIDYISGILIKLSLVVFEYSFIKTKTPIILKCFSFLSQENASMLIHKD